MKVAIIGGGILGITTGYLLAKQGAKVEIFEASSNLGGLAGPIQLPDGVKVDRFYHAILSSDGNLRRICEELGIDSNLRFNETNMGFYHQGNTFPMNNLLDFAKFPILNWVDRFRLGMTILTAQLVQNWQKLEQESVESWLIRVGGRSAYENIWRPMLRAKFDGSFSSLPATYIWARLVRMKSTREGAQQKEMAGHLIGGYITLLEEMAEKIMESGGSIHLNTPIEEILIHDEIAWGVRLNNTGIPFDKILATVQTPVFVRLIPDGPPDYLESLNRLNYLGIISLLLVLKEPLSNYWTLYLTDSKLPFTGIIETTSYIDPAYVGGHHLVYLPKYVAQTSDWWTLDDEHIKQIWLKHLESMFPSFSPDMIRYSMLHRERFVEVVRTIETPFPDLSISTPIQNLYLATTAQIYPQLTNGESVTKHAQMACAEILPNP